MTISIVTTLCIQRKFFSKNTIRKIHTLWSIDSQEISKIGATRCQILRLKCTKFDFRLGSGQKDIPRPLPALKGPTSKGREGKREGERKGKVWRRGEGREGRRRKGKRGRRGERGWEHAPIGIFESGRL